MDILNENTIHQCNTILLSQAAFLDVERKRLGVSRAEVVRRCITAYQDGLRKKARKVAKMLA